MGGHCIGIDPYYLTHLASQIGHESEVILAGRKINDSMAGFVAGRIHERLTGGKSAKKTARILALGVTFKEDVPDIRNSKAVDLIEALRECGHQVDVHDAMADPAEAKAELGLDLLDGLAGRSGYDCVVGIVPHAAYRGLGRADFEALLSDNGLVADMKNTWGDLDLGPNLNRWVL